MGIDVYSGDGSINWKKVRAAGHAFGIAKASEGLNHIDSHFSTNLLGMKSAGMVRGAYHFYHVGQDPYAQASLFLKTMKDAGYNYALDLPPCLDIEDRQGTDQYGVARLRKDVSTFLHSIENVTGRLCLIYGDYDFLQNSLGEGYGGHPLWIASYAAHPKVPTGWKTWTFWQHDDHGHVDGLPNPGTTDLDSYNGTETELRAWAMQR